ncbi:DUF418 domain-containing protein [Gordonia sinesedis]
MTGRRYIALDVLRGIAILGTLGTNIWIFTNPEGLVGYIQGTDRATGDWGIVERVLQQITQGKFLGLLTIMFGIGLAIQQRSAQRRGVRWPGGYPLRAGLLFVDGAINYVLFTEFDVLTGYAVTGLIVAYLLTMNLRNQRRALAVAAGLHAALLAILVWALAAAAPTPGAGDRLDPNPYADGSFIELAAFRLAQLPIFRAEVIGILPMSIALFLAGAALLRAGVLEPRGAMLRRRLMLIGFGVALPLDVVAGLFGGAAGLILGRYGIAPFVSLAILAAVASWYVDGRRAGAVGDALSPIGRTALSCYVLQNAVAGAVCYGWGLGLAARLDGATVVPATVALFVAISVGMMIGARLWLRRFERGPLEWLWHASYQALVPADRPVPLGSMGRTSPTPAREVSSMTDPGDPIPGADDADVIEQETTLDGVVEDLDDVADPEDIEGDADADADDDYPHTSHDEADAEIDSAR